jgi:hypothetical protein
MDKETKIALFLQMTGFVTLPFYLMGEPTYKWMFTYAYTTFFPLIIFGSIFLLISKYKNQNELRR